MYLRQYEPAICRHLILANIDAHLWGGYIQQGPQVSVQLATMF